MSYRLFTFKDRQEYSDEHTKELDDFYKIRWDIDYIEIVSDKERQLKGIDKILHLKDGTSIAIDEKIESIKHTENIIFEDKTDIDNDVAGWLKDGQLTDFVVFYQVNMQKVYVIPFPIMYEQYKAFKDNWMERGLSRTIMNQTNHGYYQGRVFIVPKTEVFNYLSKVSDIEPSNFEYAFPSK